MSDENLRQPISEITEMPEGFGLDHFLISVGLGTLVGTLAMLIGLGWEAGFDIDLEEIGAAVLFIGFFVAVFTFIGFVVIGLPTTLLLSAIKKETAANYGVVGALAGFVAIAVIFEVHRTGGWEMLWFPAVGALAGFVCAYRWGRWREAVADFRRSIRPTRRSNPIHDLTH